MTEGVGRDIVQRPRILMSDEDARNFLKQAEVAHVATICEDGWPYVIPLVHVYEGGSKLYLHIGSIRKSLFLDNVRNNPRVCIEVTDKGDLQPGKQYACQSALVYSSVVAYGTIKEIEDEDQKTWFFDRLLEKLGNPEWKFDPGYPFLNKIMLFEVELEQITGKQNEGLRH